MIFDDALKVRLLLAREALNKQDARMRNGEITGDASERWQALREWDSAKHAVITALLQDNQT